MAVYPLTQSQTANITAEEARTFIKSPALIARRLSEILNAQNFLSLFLLQGRYTVEGGAIAVPKNEQIRADREAEVVAPGAEYKLTTFNDREYEIYQSMKLGIATEVTDESITRLAYQPIDDAMQFLRTELLFGADDAALETIEASVAGTYQAAAPWTTAEQAYADAVAIREQVRRLRLGYEIDTVVLPSTQYATIKPLLTALLPANSTANLEAGFPNLDGLTWVSDVTGKLTRPLFLDRARLGGVARENIQSPGYTAVGNDTGVEVKSFHVDTADKWRVQARNPHVPVVTNPQAGVFVEGTVA